MALSAMQWMSPLERRLLVRERSYRPHCVGETCLLSLGGALLGLGVTASSSLPPVDCAPATVSFFPVASLSSISPGPSRRPDWAVDLLSPSPVRYQLLKSPDLSGVGEGDRRLSRLEGELGVEEAGEGSLEDAGGEGGSAGRSLWRGLIWRMTGRGAALESCVLVNECYHACLWPTG
jgi:hypothetical protein